MTGLDTKEFMSHLFSDMFLSLYPRTITSSKWVCFLSFSSLSCFSMPILRMNSSSFFEGLLITMFSVMADSFLYMQN